VKDLRSIDIHTVVPVDLNAIMYENERLLSKFHKGNEKESYFLKQSQKRITAIENVLWCRARKSWFDFNITGESFRTREFHVSNLSPLWFGAYENKTEKEIKAVIKKYEKSLNGFPGGSPTSDSDSGQQWDFPNVWVREY
jgi:alpha,alpha-trehalase